MRARCLLAACALGACSPDVYPDTYLCGPELYCPPDQACDPTREMCTQPEEVTPFACPAGTEAREPDDALDEAGEVTLGCGMGTEFEGCISDGDDVDVVRLQVPAGCVGGRLEFNLRYALALAPLRPELTDAEGAPLALGECTAFQGNLGDATACAAIDDVPAEVYLHLALEPGADCDGECPYNRYAVSALPRS